MQHSTQEHGKENIPKLNTLSSDVLEMVHNVTCTEEFKLCDIPSEESTFNCLVAVGDTYAINNTDEINEQWLDELLDIATWWANKLKHNIRSGRVRQGQWDHLQERCLLRPTKPGKNSQCYHIVNRALQDLKCSIITTNQIPAEEIMTALIRHTNKTCGGTEVQVGGIQQQRH